MKREAVIGTGIGLVAALPYVAFSSPRLNFVEDLLLMLSAAPIAGALYWIFPRKKARQL